MAAEKKGQLTTPDLVLRWLRQLARQAPRRAPAKHPQYVPPGTETKA